MDAPTASAVPASGPADAGGSSPASAPASGSLTPGFDRAFGIAPAAPSDDAAPAAEPFSFGGREWASREAAEQHLRSLDGQSRRARQAAAELKAWRARASELQQRLEALEAQAPSRQAPAEKAAPQPRGIGALSQEQLRTYSRLAETEGAEQAAMYLLDAYDEHAAGARAEELKKLRDELRAERDEALGPLVERQTFDASRDLFLQQAAKTDRQGRALYPGLADPTSRQAIVEGWVDLVKRNPHYGLSVNGFRVAYATWLEESGGVPEADGNSPDTTGATVEMSDVRAERAADTRRLASVATGAPGGAHAAPKQESAPDKFLREMLEMRGARSKYGFSGRYA